MNIREKLKRFFKLSKTSPEKNPKEEIIDITAGLTPEEIEDLTERSEILLNQANVLFDRLENNIFNFKNRVTTFFAILIAIVSIQISFLPSFLSLMGKDLSFNLFIYEIIPSVVLIVIVGVMIFRLFWITKYEDVDMFEEDRFAELADFGKYQLYSDFLHYQKESYLKNYVKHSDEIRWFKRCNILFLIAIGYYLVIICINFVYKFKILGMI